MKRWLISILKMHKKETPSGVSFCLFDGLFTMR